MRSWSVAQGNLPTDEVYDFAASPAPGGGQVVWLASRSGLVRFRGDHAQVFDRRHGLPSNAVRGVSAWRSPDGIDVIWVATEAGVSRAVIGASAWQTASLLGAHSIGVFGVLVTRARAGTHDISPILRAGSARSWAACNERVDGCRSRGRVIVPILIQGSSNRQRRSIQSARDDVCTQAPSIRINAPSKHGRKIDHMSRDRPRSVRARANYRPCARSSSSTGFLRPCPRERRANVTRLLVRAGL